MKRCAIEVTLVYPITLSSTEVRIILKPGLFDFYIGLLLRRSGSDGGMTYINWGPYHIETRFVWFLYRIATKTLRFWRWCDLYRIAFYVKTFANESTSRHDFQDDFNLFFPQKDRIGKKSCKFFFLCGHKSPPIGENAVNQLSCKLTILKMYDLNSRREISKLIINLQYLWSSTKWWEKRRNDIIFFFFQWITVALPQLN